MEYNVDNEASQCPCAHPPGEGNDYMLHILRSDKGPCSTATNAEKLAFSV